MRGICYLFGFNAFKSLHFLLNHSRFLGIRGSALESDSRILELARGGYTRRPQAAHLTGKSSLSSTSLLASGAVGHATRGRCLPHSIGLIDNNQLPLFLDDLDFLPPPLLDVIQPHLELLLRERGGLKAQ